MTLSTERIRTTADIEAFLAGSEEADFAPHNRDEAYAFVRRTLVGFRYHFGASRKEKGLVRRFLAKVTGCSAFQLTRLIAQQRRAGGIRDHRKKPPARPFPTRYTAADIALLAEMDEAWQASARPPRRNVLPGNEGLALADREALVESMDGSTTRKLMGGIHPSPVRPRIDSRRSCRPPPASAAVPARRGRQPTGADPAVY